MNIEDEERRKLKSALRQLVVEYTNPPNALRVLRDYRRLTKTHVSLEFLVKHCSDCFLFTGPQKNPFLTVIGPTSKQSDICVQKPILPKPTIQFKKVRRGVQPGTGQAAGRIDTRILLHNLHELIPDIQQLLAKFPEGVWLSDLIAVYREHFGRELPMERCGFSSMGRLVNALGDCVHVTASTDGYDLLLSDQRAPAPPRAKHRAISPPRARAEFLDSEDALPGIDYDDGVFPEDCISFMECIPALSLAELQEGALIVVKVGEVYSPSHFWLMRVGEEYDVALCELMNQMAKYYGIGEGKHRRLEWGAIAVGHYCAALYDREWHRALIVRRVTSYTVKVRYVDYGTVDTVAIESLKPLLRCYAELPVQAVRARLGGLRPWAGASRWPITATKQLLKLVYEARFFAKIVTIDRKEDILETFLIDTSTSNDVCLSRELIRGQHADARADSALRAVECYLFPHFEALEKGATPNYGDIRRYLRGGIKLDSVEDYYRYVPRSLSLLRSQSAPNLASPAPTPPTSLRPLPRALPVAGGGVTLAEADFTLPVAGGGVTLAEADCTVPVAGGK